MAKQLTTIKDSSGKFHQRKLDWALRKQEEGLCFRDGNGVFVFRQHPQTNVRAGLLTHEAAVARVGLGDRRSSFVPPMSDGYSGMNFHPYPAPSKATHGSLRPPLREQFPGLARDGAGLR